MHWIKLTDEKPPLYATVLVIRQGVNIYDPLHYLSVDTDQYSVTTKNGVATGDFTFNDVTYWMPMNESTRRLSKTELTRLFVEQSIAEMK
ncbi:MAG: hypothetical protein PHE50_03035 [Dehalococcoidales bacterium]|nr:hypothetical protein [Dehalococcoidales bacterium]